MYCSPQENRKARVKHICTNCAQPIEPGEKYVRWMSVDDSMFTNKMHPECLKALQDAADGYSWEYEAFGGERPVVDPDGIEPSSGG